jgi:hypothetical protein
MQYPMFVNSACTCMDTTTGTKLTDGTCCSLGSATCGYSKKTRTLCVIDGQMCPRPLRQSAVGHFISGSISWKATGPHSVEFEIMSTWRMSFTWPYKAPLTTYTGPCGYPGVGDRVPIVGIASSKAGNSTQTMSTVSPLQRQIGNSFLQLESGAVTVDAVTLT